MEISMQAYPGYLLQLLLGFFLDVSLEFHFKGGSFCAVRVWAGNL
jgi:hypothetical protein